MDDNRGAGPNPNGKNQPRTTARPRQTVPTRIQHPTIAKERNFDYTPRCPFFAYRNDPNRSKYMYGKCQKSLTTIDSYRPKREVRAVDSYCPKKELPTVTSTKAATSKPIAIKVSGKEPSTHLPELLSPSLPSPIAGDDLFS